MTANASRAMSNEAGEWHVETNGLKNKAFVAGHGIELDVRASKLPYEERLAVAQGLADKLNADHALAAEVQRLRTALEPLAALIDVLPDATQIIHRDEVPFYSFDGVELTYGDARRARAALDASGGE